MKKSVDLFCLPFAGGNKYSYRKLAEKATSHLNIVTFDYPGRGARTNEPLIEDIDTLVDDLYNQIKNRIGQKDYGIYGHSLGGLLAYLLARKLIENNYKSPQHLFITGTTGPSAISRTEKKIHLLSKKEFLDQIKNYGGMPEEILQSEEWLYYFEPVLRADFKASENYMYKNVAPLKIPITVITGCDENLEIVDIEVWQKETDYLIDFRRMPGNHFFIFKNTQAIMEIIYKKLFIFLKAYQS